ncbi:MAG: serine hydrolase domain-containing protein, partial [Gemmataceae bacterium]
FLLIENDVPIWLAGFGRADIPDDVPVTPGTIFDLASLSKHFTAYAILLLASRGKLAPTDEVRQHIPELERHHADPRPLRLTDLIHHSSGLPDYIGELLPEEHLTFTNARLIDWVIEQPLEFPTGTRGFSFRDENTTYCNTNYCLLASVVERVSGKSFPFFMKTEIFKPLGMNDTFIDPYQGNHPGLARRHDRDGRFMEHPRVIPLYGDGSAYSTIADFVRWDRELTFSTLMAPQDRDRLFQAGTLDDGSPTDYGWGFYVKSWPDRRVVWHGGNWDGTSTCFSRWLDDGIRLALFSNTQSQAAPTILSEIEHFLMD